ncbi:MAG: FkbM family methyltransferase [Azospirillaceae bacterium]
MKFVGSARRRLIDRALRGTVMRILETERVAGQYQLDASMCKGSGRDLARSSSLSERARRLLSYLSPSDPVGATFRRVGREHDGGYVMVSEFLDGHIAYSIGIGDDVSWDIAIAELGYDVFQYDHTVDNPNAPNSGRFHARRICGENGKISKDDLTLSECLIENGHSDANELVLKIDIEGDEWDIFNTVQPETLAHFSQIAVEFHHIHHCIIDVNYSYFFDALNNIRTQFTPVHVHANNAHDFCIIGGVPVPPTLEVTFIRSDVCKFSENTRTFPTILDSPNYYRWPELYLGKFVF